MNASHEFEGRIYELVVTTSWDGGRSLLREQFNWEKIAGQVEGIYSGIVGER